MNWERWSASLSVMNAVTQTGKLSTCASRIAAHRCCPSTIQPGLAISVQVSSIGMTNVPGRA
jgi:hypothetical protein